METIWQDIRYATRSLLKKPGFTLVVIFTLALGIGANTAIFSFVNAVLLQPLPYKEPDRLVRIGSLKGGEYGPVSLREIEDIKEQLDIFEDIAAYRLGAAYNVSGDGPPEEVPAILCSHNLFNVLGVAPLYGAPWPAQADREPKSEVVLNYNFWRRKFGGQPDIVGRKITLDAGPFYTVHGVLPPGFNLLFNSDLFRSITIFPSQVVDRHRRGAQALARLKPGVSYEQAQAELTALGKRLAQTYPATNSAINFSLTPLKDLYLGDVRPYLLLLLAAVSFVLLIGCANVINLLLTRATGRQQELAIRTALGATRIRLIRQLLGESLLLALTGGAAGLALAAWSIHVSAELVRTKLPYWVEVKLDARVLVFTLAVSILAGLLAGLLPALQASRPDLNEMLKHGGRGSLGASHRRRLRQLLVVSEIALALILLVGAGLLVKSFVRLQQSPLGFKTEGVLTFRVALAYVKYLRDEGGQKNMAFFRQVLENIEALPGVQGAAVNMNLPLSPTVNAYRSVFTAEGQSADDQRQNPYVNEQRVTPKYFDVMKIPIVRGRGILESDQKSTLPVALLSERLAERLFPGQDPLGKRLKLGQPELEAPWLTIVGITGNVRHEQVTREAGFDLYLPFYQRPDLNQYVVVKTSVPPLTLAEAVTKAVWAVDPEQSNYDLAPMEDRLADQVWPQRLSGAVFAAFAILATLLASVGIYGVMSYAVSQQTREIGIRLALGAQPRDVLRKVIAEVLKLTASGILVGLVGAFFLTRLMTSLVYEVSVIDPLTFLVVPLLLITVAFVAGLIPARRAARVDPLVALRYE